MPKTFHGNSHGSVSQRQCCVLTVALVKNDVAYTHIMALFKAYFVSSMKVLLPWCRSISKYEVSCFIYIRITCQVASQNNLLDSSPFILSNDISNMK